MVEVQTVKADQIKKYLISIQEKGGARYDSFFSHPEFVESEFTKIGIRGLALSTKEYFEAGVKFQEKPLTPSELGCALSHRGAVADFLNSDAKYLYVFEDDVKVKHHFDFNQHLDFLGEGFVLSLGGIKLSVCKSVRGQIIPETFFGQAILKVSPAFYDSIFYAMGYVMDRKAAVCYLKFQQVPQVADHWRAYLDQNPAIRYYMTDILSHPDIHEVCSENSTLESERIGQKMTAYKKYKLLPLLSLWFKYRMSRVYRKLAVLFSKKYQ